MVATATNRTSQPLTPATTVSVTGDDNLSYAEYVCFYMRLVYAFNHDDDDNDMDAEETLTALAVDWANDSHGDGDVDYEDFLDSVFELALKWAEDGGEYVPI